MFGKNIQKLRKEKKLTLTQLAEKTEISKSYLSHIERNIQTNPSIDVLVKIASALDVDIQTLLSQDQPSPQSTITKKVHVADWSELIRTALESGLINERDLRGIKLAIKKSEKNL